ncbi:MAG: hypothetical protein KDD51_07675 [Bdellovibrionales bacterium]|nr:hypothetical protein [Bdellovibrionales bacterium]
MPDTAALLGKYELSLGNQKWEEHLTQVEFHTELDEPSRLSVSVAVNAKELAKTSGGALPATASLKWQDMGVFKGTLIHCRTVSHSLMVLTYADSLFAAKKTMLNGFYKKQSLKEVLEKLSKEIGLRARFQGNFSEKLPGLNVGGKTIFDHFSTLAAKFGFYFSYRSFADTLYFVRVGESVKSQKLDCCTDTADVSIGQAGSEAYSQVTLRYFDPKSMETKEKKISKSTLYGHLGGFAEHPTYRHKMEWASAAGSLESHVTDLYHFENAEELLGQELSKKLMAQETIRLKVFKPIALPGDKLQLSEAPAGALQDGDYLIKSMALTVNSALPYAELYGIRP